MVTNQPDGETVAREALGVIFEGADASGFEEDARLTAMWLWTLNSNQLEAVRNQASTGRQQQGMLEGEAEVEDDEGGKHVRGDVPSVRSQAGGPQGRPRRISYRQKGQVFSALLINRELVGPKWDA